MRLPVARFKPSPAAFIVAVASLAVALVLGAIPAGAAPPPDADPSLAPWFQSLRQPGTGILCCSLSDCRATSSRMTASGYEALIDNRWLPVPSNRVLEHTPNPTGRAIVCYLPGQGILCFVRPSET
jgi:hypothetical protein